jgi:hypothetical protein
VRSRSHRVAEDVAIAIVGFVFAIAAAAICFSELAEDGVDPIPAKSKAENVAA